MSIHRAFSDILLFLASFSLVSPIIINLFILSQMQLGSEKWQVGYEFRQVS
jgi:hypothetical protein